MIYYTPYAFQELAQLKQTTKRKSFVDGFFDLARTNRGTVIGTVSGNNRLTFNEW